MEIILEICLFYAGQPREISQWLERPVPLAGIGHGATPDASAICSHLIKQRRRRHRDLMNRRLVPFGKCNRQAKMPDRRMTPGRAAIRPSKSRRLANCELSQRTRGVQSPLALSTRARANPSRRIC